MDPVNPVAPSFFDVFPVIFGIVAVLVLAAFVYVIVASVRQRKVLRDAGHDPTTFSADLAVRAMKSDLLAPERQGSDTGAPSKSIEERLAELEDLHARGVITAAERADARARIISGG